MSWPEDLRKLARLEPGRLGLLAEAGLSLAAATIRVRCAGAGLARLLRQPAGVAAGDASGWSRLAGISWSIDAVARRLPRDPTCLIRAVAARSMLARRGVRCRIRIGISEDTPEFRPHAWVEVGQRPLLGWIKGERFKVLAEIR